MPAHMSPDYTNTPDAARADWTLQQHLDQFIEESLKEALSRGGDGLEHMTVLPQETQVQSQDAVVSSSSTLTATQAPVFERGFEDSIQVFFNCVVSGSLINVPVLKSAFLSMSLQDRLRVPEMTPKNGEISQIRLISSPNGKLTIVEKWGFSKISTMSSRRLRGPPARKLRKIREHISNAPHTSSQTRATPLSHNTKSLLQLPFIKISLK